MNVKVKLKQESLGKERKLGAMEYKGKMEEMAKENS